MATYPVPTSQAAPGRARSESGGSAAPPPPAELMRMSGARRSVFLTSLPEEDLASVLAAASMPWFDAQDAISSSSAPDDALHVLLEGAAIQLAHPSDEGEYFARPIAAGDVIGLAPVLLQPSPPSDHLALLRTATLRIPGPSIRAMAEESAGMARALSRVAVVALSEAEIDRVVLATGDAMTRVTRRITELARTWGHAGPRGTEIDLPVTQEQLGAWAGVSRETTVKCLQWLRSRDLIATSRRHIRVRDVDELEELTRRRGAGLVLPRRPPVG